MHGGKPGCPFANAAAAQPERAVAGASMSRPGSVVPKSGYGPAEPGDYRGVVRGGRRDDSRTDELFRAIQEHSFRGDDLEGQVLAPESEMPPAGYTYLGQFAAHDLTLSSLVGQDPKMAREPENTRKRPLLLDSLYGEPGSAHTPWLSRLDTRGKPLKPGWPATRFVLSPVGGAAMRRIEAPAGFPARDIGRAIVTAPAGTSPSAYDIFRPGAAGDVEFGIPMVADPRNDDQPLIAQLTALFKIAHNLAMAALDKASPPASPAAAQRNFDTARLALTAVFRRILRDDLLGRLLDPVVYGYYRKSPRFLDEPDDARPVSRDFAHAAYRACHAMIRPLYPFGRNIHRLRKILDNTSAYRGGVLVPLQESWIIDWSLLFPVRGSDPARAHPLIPQFSAALRDLPLKTDRALPPPDGLLYKDLWSGALSGVRRISTLLEQIRTRQPDLAAGSEWLRDGAKGKAAMKGWWRLSGPGDAAWMEKEITSNPPPLLYVLAEAAAARGGRSLGPLGSVIVADTFFRALAASSSAAEEACERVFGKTPPADMPALVLWIDARMDRKHKRTASGTPLPFAS